VAQRWPPLAGKCNFAEWCVRKCNLETRLKTHISASRGERELPASTISYFVSIRATRAGPQPLESVSREGAAKSKVHRPTPLSFEDFGVD
jgi:hypothetical protein